MGIFDFFKNKDNNASLNIITLEDSIAKMFSSSGIEPSREENKFATVVEGKHCVFNVALTSMDGNRLRCGSPWIAHQTC